MGLPGDSVLKNPPANVGDVGLLPELGRTLEPEMAPQQYSCLENSTDSRTWGATVHAVARVGHDWVTEHSTAHNIHIQK